MKQDILNPALTALGAAVDLIEHIDDQHFGSLKDDERFLELFKQFHEKLRPVTSTVLAATLIGGAA